MTLHRLLAKFERNQVFTEAEGWMLFRLAAIGEAVGWSLLIFGIMWQRAGLAGGSIPVQLAGKTHGMLFLLYGLASVGLYPALAWPRRRAFVALLASVPPYGSLLFEQWAAQQRNRADFRRYQYCVLLVTLGNQET